MMRKNPKRSLKLFFSKKPSLPFWQRLSTHIYLYILVFSFLFVFTAVAISFGSSRQVILDETSDLPDHGEHVTEIVRRRREKAAEERDLRIVRAQRVVSSHRDRPFALRVPS